MDDIDWDAFADGVPQRKQKGYCCTDGMCGATDCERCGVFQGSGLPPYSKQRREDHDDEN